MNVTLQIVLSVLLFKVINQIRLTHFIKLHYYAHYLLIL